MRWAEGFIAVDWGTTNRRAYRISADGTVEQEMEDDKGILSVPSGGFAGAVEDVRSRLGECPLLMAGMIGSNRGWIEAPYVPTPADVDDIARRLCRVEGSDAAIVAGVSHVSEDAADVMRGEEVQLVGAVAAGLMPATCLVCHPGTHNKWVQMSEGRIIAFRTVMTGEIFNLLREHSILADLLDEPAIPDAVFEAGVRHGLDHDDLTAELFSVRARVLLGQAKREHAASYTSGLLIGADVRVGLNSGGGDVVIAMGRPELTRLFATALKVAARDVCEVDGEQAFLAGARAIAERAS